MEAGGRRRRGRRRWRGRRRTGRLRRRGRRRRGGGGGEAKAVVRSLGFRRAWPGAAAKKRTRTQSEETKAKRASTIARKRAELESLKSANKLMRAQLAALPDAIVEWVQRTFPDQVDDNIMDEIQHHIDAICAEVQQDMEDEETYEDAD